MGTITLTKQENKFILMNTLEEKEVLKQDMVDAVRVEGYRGILPFDIREARKRKVIISDLTGMYSVLTRLQAPIDSREIVLILKGMLDSVALVSKQRIPPTYIDMDLDYVFVKRSGDVLLTLWAVEHIAPKQTVMNLFKQVGTTAKPRSPKDKSFLDKYIQLFNADFTMDKLHRFIMTAYDKLKQSAIQSAVKSEELSEPIPVQPVVEEQPVQEVRQSVHEISQVEPSNEQVSDVSGLMHEEDEGFILNPTNQTTFLTNEDNATTVLGNLGVAKRFLRSKKTGVEYELSLGETYIGKSADVSIAESSAISRRHAKVTIFEGVVTIEDVGSSNGTRLNGTPLVPNETEELMSGDTVALADLELEYHEE